jgi:Uma2 family endonuclease
VTHLELRAGASLTVEDLEAFERDGRRYELYDGTLVVTPSPVLRHQLAVSRLYALLAVAAPPDLLALVGPFDWVVGPTTVFEPDVLVFRRADVTEDSKRLEAPPVLVIEVLSPSTRPFDLHAKRATYAAGGAGWYWLVDPEVPSLTVLRLEDGAYVEQGSAAGDDPLSVELPFPMTVVPSSLTNP